MPAELVTILPIVLMIAIMYFLMIRPQKKQEKELQQMINAIKIGDEILTIGGIHGKIKKIKDDNITIVTSTEKTPIEISRWAIKDVTMYVEDSKEAKKEAEAAEKAEESKK